MPFGLFNRKPKQPPADTPKVLQLSAQLELEAVGKAGSDKPTFELVAYTGEPMQLAGFFDPVIIDLDGVEFDKESTPVIADHDTSLRIGHSTRQQVSADGIFVTGVVSSSMGIAAGFVEDARNGFPFQVSVGAAMLESSFVEAGQSANVNGKEHAGPLIIARRSLVREFSVTVLGADSKTAATIAATRNTNNPTTNFPQGEKNMPSPTDLQAERSRIQAINSALTPPQSGWGSVANDVEALRSQAIDGTVPIAELPQRVLALMELNAIRDERPAAHQGGGIHATHSRPADPVVLEAAIASHARVKGLEKHYGENTLHAAEQLGVTCLMDAAKLACQMAGKTNIDWRSKDAVIRAAFSTADIGTLLSNVAGKSLEEAYKAFPSVARVVARKLSANDFRQKTGIRVTGDIQFKEVAGDGEIKHGVLNDSSYTYQLATYARMFGMDRQSIVNDDLDALEEVPRLLGRGAALALEETFWTLVLANAGSFFSAGNGNLLTGAGSALSSSGLSDAVTAFLEQTDQEGKPIGVVPERMVVPPALKSTADELYVARTLNVGGGSTSTDNRLPGENVHFGKYEPSPVPWIGSNGGLTSGSDAHWYLFGNPNDVAAFGIAYLDGNEVPKIEQEDAPFNTLGVQWRGYLDFGVCQIDHRGAVRSAGA